MVRLSALRFPSDFCGGGEFSLVVLQSSGALGAARTLLHVVIASGSEAIQSSRRMLDCFVAELVIGPATSGRTRWLLAMLGGRPPTASDVPSWRV